MTSKITQSRKASAWTTRDQVEQHSLQTIYSQNFIIYSQNFIIYSQNYVIYSQNKIIYFQNQIIYSQNCIIYSQNYIIYSQNYIIEHEAKCYTYLYNGSAAEYLP